MKHSVVTVVNKRRKEPNYGQKHIIPIRQTMTTKTSQKGCQARRIKNKKIITFYAHRSTPGYDQDI